MGIPSINSLKNMEYMLYGNRIGQTPNCPSMANGYVLNQSIFNNPMQYNYTGNMYTPSFYGYYNPTNFGQQIPQNYNYTKTPTDTTTEQTNENTSFQQAITQDDMNRLADYYAKNNALEEGFMGAATGGLSWMAFEHAQSLVHPLNAKEGITVANEIFKQVPKEFLEKNSTLCQEAYTAVQQAARDTQSKWKISGWVRKQLDANAVNPYIENVKNAAITGDVEGLAKATEELKATRGMDGKITGLLTGTPTVAERLAKEKTKENIASNSQILTQISTGGFKELVKSSFKRDFMGFMLFETVFNIGKIITAFGEDTETGLKQTGQSLAKSAIGTSGWCLGRAAGAWAAAKLGAKFGSKISPLWGTILGGIIGFTGASIGMWAGHKLGNLVLGTDVADKVEAKQMAATQDGQVQLLQFAAQKAQEGKTDAQTNLILNKAINSAA